MTIDFDIFCPFMEDLIIVDFDGRHVIIVDDGRLGEGKVQVFHKVVAPLNLTDGRRSDTLPQRSLVIQWFAF